MIPASAEPFAESCTAYVPGGAELVPVWQLVSPPISTVVPTSISKPGTLGLRLLPPKQTKSRDAKTTVAYFPSRLPSGWTDAVNGLPFKALMVSVSGTDW